MVDGPWATKETSTSLHRSWSGKALVSPPAIGQGRMPAVPITDDPQALNPIAAEHYGSKTVAVEPGGVEIIPDSERHGRPINLLWTWTSPNLEFATIGGRASSARSSSACPSGRPSRRSCWAPRWARPLTACCRRWGPRLGLCQMVLGRTAFDSTGNVLPAGINALVAGIGWFAVNSISGALALHAPRRPAQVAVPADHRGRPADRGVLRAQPGARLRALRPAAPGGRVRDRRGDRLRQGRPRRPGPRRSQVRS